MNLIQATVTLLIQFAFMTFLTNGLYVEGIEKAKSGKVAADNDEAWNVFKERLGLSDEKIQLLKSQKDKQRTFELLNRFLEENPHYTVEKENSREEVEEKKVSDEDFMEVYHNILRQLKHSRRTLKTSLSFEIIDTTHSLRKISVNLVSDLPSGKIYQLIKMFNGNRAISDQETEVYIADSDSSEASSSIYNKVYSKLPPGNRRGYTHTHGRDLYTPNKPVHSSQYASLQDLILQGRRS